MKTYQDMELHVNRHKNLMYISVVVLASILLASINMIPLVSPSANAQEDQNEMSVTKTFQNVIEEFVVQAEENPNFQLAIRLHKPLLDGASTYIVPQRRDSEDGVSRVVIEIGEDYVCFDTTAAGTRLIECVPFSNIVGIDYLVP